MKDEINNWKYKVRIFKFSPKKQKNKKIIKNIISIYILLDLKIFLIIK